MSTQFNCQKHFYFKLFSLFKQLYITIQFSVSTVSMSKTVQFQIIQFSINTLSRPRSDGNKRVLRIPGTSPSDSKMSSLEHSLVESYLIAEMQSLYCAAPDDWAT